MMSVSRTPPTMASLSRMPRTIALALIKVYQHTIGPTLPPACRYQPTCSHYAATAIERYGLLRGVWLAARRLLRCHPFGGKGYDPVP